MMDRDELLAAARAATNGNGVHPPAVAVRRTTLADVRPERVTWRWLGRLPVGKVVIVEGPPGLGKSTLVLNAGAAFSNGDALPGGEIAKAADVLVVSYEDGVSDTIVPRVLAAGGDARRVHVIEGVTRGQDPERPFTIPDDVAPLREEIDATGARLVIIDPFGAALAGSHDAHRDQDVRRGIAPLARMADETGATIVIVRHLRKGANGSAIDAGMGSIGITGAARVVLSVHRHPEDAERRVLAVTKCNLAAEAPSLVWRLVSVPEFGCARVEWLGESDLRADALLAAQRDESDDGSTRDERSEWLQAVLVEGALPARDVLRLARQAGHAERSIQRTAQRVGVITTREGSGRDHRVLWSLPRQHTHMAPVAPVAGVNDSNGLRRDTDLAGVAPVAPVQSTHATTHATGVSGNPVSDITHATHATHATCVGEGVIQHPDGSQEFTPEKIAELQEQRRVRQAEREALEAGA